MTQIVNDSRWIEIVHLLCNVLEGDIYDLRERALCHKGWTRIRGRAGLSTVFNVTSFSAALIRGGEEISSCMKITLLGNGLIVWHAAHVCTNRSRLYQMIEGGGGLVCNEVFHMFHSSIALAIVITIADSFKV